VSVIGSKRFKVRVPSGFKLELLTSGLSLPRIIHRHNDTLLIGSRAGSVYRLDPPYNKPVVIAQLRDYPHSVVVHNGFLYVAQTSGVVRTPWPVQSRRALKLSDFEPVVDVPGGRGHNSRTLKLGPDDRLYLSLGITGNCSNEYLDTSYPWKDQRGGFFVLSERVQDGRSSFSLVSYASGLRNPVGFDWHPSTDVMYASNNGPDHLGYEFPRESFTAVTEQSFHGMPWFQWNADTLMRDPCIDSAPPRDGADVVKPVATFPARIAPMDVTFVPPNDESWADYEYDAVVALHGSWATSDGSGGGDPASRREPQIVTVSFDQAGRSNGQVKPLIHGFQLENGDRWARPMGVSFGDNGALFFTSDGGTEGLFRLSPIENQP